MPDTTGSITNIITDPHFIRLTAATRRAYYATHDPYRLRDRVRNDLDQLMKHYTTNQINLSEHATAFQKLLALVRRVTPAMPVRPEDLTWYLDSVATQGAVVVTLFGAYAVARERMVTPAEVAAATGTGESTWRNRAAAGDIPGALMKGKQWLLPADTLAALYGVSIPERTRDQTPLSPDDEAFLAAYDPDADLA